MMHLTPLLVKGLWQHMQRVYGTKLIDKRNAIEMVMLSKALDKMGVINQADFLERYTTVLHKRIYAPFEPGVETPRHNLLAQVKICAHEHQHVEQLNRELGFMARYLLSPAERARYEVEAYTTSMELQWFLTGELADIDAIVNSLRSYALRDGDLAVARVSLVMAARAVSSGGVSTPAARMAIRWLSRNA
jgi:hypothetical protein